MLDIEKRSAIKEQSPVEETLAEIRVELNELNASIDGLTERLESVRFTEPLPQPDQEKVDIASRSTLENSLVSIQGGIREAKERLIKLRRELRV